FPAALVLAATGKVFILGGGFGHGSLASAEIYDPYAGTFIPAGNANIASYSDDNTIQLGNGRVLLTNGGSTQIYDPVLGTFANTATPLLITNGGAVLLPTGKVLRFANQVAGGTRTTDAELFSPGQ